MGQWNFYGFRNQELFQRKYSSNFFPDPPHHPQNQTNLSTDSQEETVNYSDNLVPF